MLYFTADHHFHHKNILKYEKRPFPSVEEMNVSMIDKWNSCVTKEDIVYHLGDFAFGGRERVEKILNSLNFKEFHLIKGNHDAIKPSMVSLFTSIHEYLELKIDDTFFILFHYPMESWNGKFRGSIHLHGHVHAQGETLHAQPGFNRMNVGVDCWNYEPVSLTKILELKNNISFTY